MLRYKPCRRKDTGNSHVCALSSGPLVEAECRRSLPQDDAESRNLFRDMLRTEVRHFTSEYNALMYGGTAMSQVRSVRCATREPCRTLQQGGA